MDIPEWVGNHNFYKWRQQLKAELYTKRNGLSDLSGIPLLTCHMHEGIISRAVVPKSVRWHFLIYHEFNCYLLNQEEHIPNPPPRSWAINLSYERYGRDAVREWFYGLPWKVVPFQLP